MVGVMRLGAVLQSEGLLARREVREILPINRDRLPELEPVERHGRGMHSAVQILWLGFVQDTSTLCSYAAGGMPV